MQHSLENLNMPSKTIQPGHMLWLIWHRGRFLTTPQVRSSNPVFAKFYIEHVLTVEKTKIKKKRPGRPFQNTQSNPTHVRCITSKSLLLFLA